MLIIDLSSNQHDVDFAAVKRAGINAVWLKTTEGRTWNDPDWHDRARAARKHGLRVGGYHFARPDLNDPAVEAAHFADILGKIGRRDLRPALDLEHPATINLEKWARAFNTEFRHHVGIVPCFYSYPAYIQAMKLTRPVGNGLWLASYSRNDGKEHPYTIPSPWKKTIAHQFTSNAYIAGVKGPVDLSTCKRPPLAHPILGLL